MNAQQHVRHYRFFYAAAVVWATVVVVLPSVRPQSSTPGVFGAPETSVPAGGTRGGGPPTTATAVGLPAVPAGAGAGATVPNFVPVPPLELTTFAKEGRTRNGVPCQSGVPQVTFTAYSPPCAVAFTGPNGGATTNGVTATTILVTDRELPDNPILGPGGPNAEQWSIAQFWTAYFNRTFELYGRHVVLQHYKSPHGDQLAEAQGQGQDAACQDAIALTQELHVFTVATTDSSVFEQCAGQHHLVITDAEGRPPEPFLQQYHPYLWTYERPCFRLADQIAEYARKRLVGRPAIYAGDPAYRSRPRKVGIIVPDNEIYKPCIQQAEKEFGAPVDEFDYQVDAARLPDESAQAAVHFKADGVTTLVLTDSISADLLTHSARSENWYPEWVISGIGGTDSNSTVRGWDATEITGHLFGETENPAQPKLFGPQAEPVRLYKQLTGKNLDTANVGTGSFYTLLQLFRLLQGAGPHLTPETLAAGAFGLPETNGPIGSLSYNYGPDGQVGQIDHGSMLDANEVYWDANAVDFFGGKGAYIVNPRRYRSGQWPTSPPDIYPKR